MRHSESVTPESLSEFSADTAENILKSAKRAKKRTVDATRNNGQHKYYCKSQGSGNSDAYEFIGGRDELKEEYRTEISGWDNVPDIKEQCSSQQ